jgi:diaminohydroxyphosphoribosylaminopyrimidine deaminase/5-amino-6-(5-phosphoribosylamino)uracil reductase
VRVVVDSHLRTPLSSKLVQTAKQVPVWFLTRHDAEPSRRAELTRLGATVIEANAGPSGLDLRDGMKLLAQAGLTRVLVEGGGQIAASLMRDDLVDRLAWFHAPLIMGSDGLPGVRDLGIAKLALMPRFIRHSVKPLGMDMLTELKRRV